MWFSKRYFLSVIFIFSFVWAGFEQFLQRQKSLDSRNSCIVISLNVSAKYLLDTSAGRYVSFHENYLDYQFRWISAVSDDGKFIAYLQPQIIDEFTYTSFRRPFDLYLEELTTGNRRLLLENLTTLSHLVYQAAILSWSPDNQLLTFFEQSRTSTEEGFGLLLDREGNILQQWDHGAYAPQWSHDGKYLSFSRFDFNSHKGTVNIWDSKSHQAKSYESAFFLQNTTTVWSPSENRMLALDDTVTPSNSSGIEYAISVISPEQENMRDIIIPFDHADGEPEYNYADFDVTLDWRDYHPTIELRFRIGGKIWQTKEFDVVTGEVVHTSNAGFAGYSDTYYVDGNLVVLAELSDVQSHTSRPVIALDHVPQKVFKVYFSFYDEVYPYWRLRNIRSVIVAWQYEDNLYLTLYDINTAETLTRHVKFPLDGNLQIEQIYDSELMSYQFIKDSVAYSGVYDTRKGEVLREFSDRMSNIPVFQPKHVYADQPLEQFRTFSFANGNTSFFINSYGEMLAEGVQQAQVFMGSPDERAVLSITGSPNQSSAPLVATMYKGRNQPSERIDIKNLRPDFYSITWAPGSELVMVRAGDHINIISINGDIMWRFPRFSSIDNAEAGSFDWVRCDVFTRWGDTEVIDHGRAERR